MNIAAANQGLSQSDLNLMYCGALGFGLIVGWFVYYINRYRKGDVQFGDITTVLAAIGGAAVVQLFGQGTGMFGAYGIGLAIGFFGYFLVLVVLVNISPNFGVDWFLDGRRKNPAADEGYGTQERPPMALQVHSGGFFGTNPGGPAAALQAVAPPLLPAPGQAESNADKVVKACKDKWPSAKGSCNGFVNAVTTEFGVSLPGTADQILDRVEAAGSGWKMLTDGVAAKAAAEQGKLVVAGLRSTDFSTPNQHGHVVIVVPGAMNPGGWAPAAYWGSIDPTIASKGGSGSPLSLCFREADGKSDKFVYRSYDW
jgi:hypothetical protein